MAIQCVGTGKQNNATFGRLNARIFFISACVMGLFSYHGPLCAKNWRLTPSIQLQEVYSDNINLTANNETKSAFVTSLNPAATIIWQVGKSNLDLRYNMQNLYNAQGNGDFTVFHQLQFNAHNVLSQNRLFVDSRSSIGQQNISNTRLASDNLSGRTTTVTTFGISPTWLPHFGNYANGMVRVNADIFSSGASAISDSKTLSEMVQLDSGSEFKRISWSMGFSNSHAYRSSGVGDVNFQNSNATLRAHINKHFSVFTAVGHSANDYRGQTNSNGLFYTVGGRWTPSTHYWLEVGGGNNSYVTINVSPMQRLSWLTTLRHNKIGTNSGTTWQTALNYRTRQSKWSLTHSNDTVTGQDIFANGGRSLDDIADASRSTSVLTDIGVNGISATNDVIVRESWNLFASFYTGKSVISLNAFNQDRTFQNSKTSTSMTEHVRGVNALWNWQFARKTSAYLRPQWQKIDTTSANNVRSQSNRYDFAIGLNQTITSRLNGRLEFSHLKQTSDLPTNDYQENRATANLFMRF